RRKLRQLDDLTAKSNTLEQQIAAAYQAGNQSLVTKLKAQQYAVSKEYEAVQKDVGIPSPARTLPTWNDIKKLIGPETAVVMYTITDSSRYVLVGTTRGLALHELSNADNIEKMVRGFRNYI